MNDLTQQFRDAVAAHLARERMSASRLGALALGDPSFVSRLRRGRVPNLSTVDRVLLRMGMAPLGPAFRSEVDAFLRITGTKEYMLGAEAAGDPSFVSRLRRGTSPRLDTVHRVREWMAAHGAAVGWEPVANRLGEPFPMAAGRAPGRPENPRPDGAGKGGGGGHRKNPIQIETEGGGSDSMKDRHENPKYLDTREAADFLGLSNRTLDRYRVTGEGPVFHKFGRRIRYALADLEAWAGARRVRSTAEADLGGWRNAS